MDLLFRLLRVVKVSRDTLNQNLKHDDLDGFAAAEHYDWTNETHNFVTTGSVVGNTIGTPNYTLPNADGADGQVLKTNGLGTVTWQAEAGGGGVTIYYGEMHVEDGTNSVPVAAKETDYEVDVAGMAGGNQSGCTFADHYIEVANAGYYLVNWNMSVDTAGLVSDQIKGGIMVNGATVAKGTSLSRVTSHAAVVGGSAILDLSADDQVSLYVNCISNARDIEIEQLSMTIVKIGDT